MKCFENSAEEGIGVALLCEWNVGKAVAERILSGNQRFQSRKIGKKRERDRDDIEEMHRNGKKRDFQPGLKCSFAVLFLVVAAATADAVWMCCDLFALFPSIFKRWLGRHTYSSTRRAALSNKRFTHTMSLMQLLLHIMMQCMVIVRLICVASTFEQIHNPFNIKQQTTKETLSLSPSIHRIFFLFHTLTASLYRRKENGFRQKWELSSSLKTKPLSEIQIRSRKTKWKSLQKMCIVIELNI